MQPIGDTIDPCPGRAGQMAMLECRLVLVSVLRFGGCILQRDESWRERGKEGEAITPARANRLAIAEQERREPVAIILARHARPSAQMT